MFFKKKRISKDLYSDIQNYISQNLIEAQPAPGFVGAAKGKFAPMAVPREAPDFGAVCAESAVPDDLDQALENIDESFSEMLLRKIDEKGMSDSQCYKKAMIDRKLFSKIRGNRLYKPSKQTAISFAIALELPLDEAVDMLSKAGYALSHSSKFDIIIEYFILKKNYNLFEINDALYSFDQPILGG